MRVVWLVGGEVEVEVEVEVGNVKECQRWCPISSCPCPVVLKTWTAPRLTLGECMYMYIHIIICFIFVSCRESVQMFKRYIFQWGSKAREERKGRENEELKSGLEVRSPWHLAAGCPCPQARKSGSPARPPGLTSRKIQWFCRWKNVAIQIFLEKIYRFWILHLI